MTKQWEDHRHIIIQEYKDNNRPLHEVRKFMEERYRFKASIRAYRSRFDKWRVRKYTVRKPRRDSLGGTSDKSSMSMSMSSSSQSSESSDDMEPGCSPPSPDPDSPTRIRRRVSSSQTPQEHSAIHYFGSGMYESTTTPAEDFLKSPSIYEPRQLYHTDHHHTLAGLLPASGLHSSQQGLVNDDFRYQPDHHQQGQCVSSIYRPVQDPVFHTKFMNGPLDHCFSGRVANRFSRHIQ